MGKTASAMRRVPIHSALAEVVSRRCDHQPAAQWLFPEAPEARGGRQRSAAISKRFGRYRQACGVHDGVDGARQSLVDFHSWRRWFITTARNAGIDRAVVAAVVGHTVGNVTHVHIQPCRRRGTAGVRWGRCVYPDLVC